MFITAQTSQKRKEVDQKTQDAIDMVTKSILNVSHNQKDFENWQAAGEIEEEPFKALFGKEQLGWIRCFGRSVTKSNLEKHVEISEIKKST
ncbi:hypothetical protein Ahy_B04g072877 [Arachis hypogaea]|uniref:Uncharacterized protein n=1 Tax=Arachis hypogaea TaxID=3818 RepID=A0A444ZNY7_ARAHY|nr:hypothetical protein Ahy_B04g072877 [Arachis hypogaea]